MQSLETILQQNSYPGRGILLGRTPNGQKAVLAYFIMGRSENSRNRVFTEKAGGIVTEAADPAKLQDPSLIIYAPVRKLNNHTIVTNGDQTDTIYNSLTQGQRFEDALRTRTFEPDAPNFTPRISGLLTRQQESFSYQLSIVKSAGGNPAGTQRFFYEYSQPLPGQGHFIHTYAGDGNPLPSFTGEPVPVRTENEIDLFGQGLWQALNADNKVALFVRYIAANGVEETRLYNRFCKA